MDGKDDAFAALVAYRKWCSDWVKWGTGKSLLVSMPFQVPYEAWEGMSDVNSSLYDEVHDLLSEKGEVGLRSMINKYFRSYFELLKLKEDGKVADVNAVEGLRTGNTFLQNVSDIALGYGVDAGGIASWGSMTQGGGGHGASSVRNIQGCQTGNNQSRCGLDDGLCNPGISQQVENQPRLSDILPKELRADETMKILQRAIDAGLVDINGQKLKWNRTKSLLAYFMGHFLVNGVFPDAIYSRLFDVQRLGQAFYRLADNKHGEGGKPRGYEEIDKLFE